MAHININSLRNKFDMLTNSVTEYIDIKLDQNFDNFESFFIELESSKKNKWLLSYSYNPYKGNIKQHLSNISKGLDELNSKYDNILIVGDLNSELSEPSLDQFCQTYNLVSIVNKPTCFKNPKNPSCIDLKLTNKKPKPLKLGYLTFIKWWFLFLKQASKSKSRR